MGHIAYITNGMSSTLNAGYAMSRRLRHAGHRVTFVAREDFGEKITAQGEAFVGLEQDRRMSAQMAANPILSLTRPIAMLSWLVFRRHLRRESIESEELTSVIRQLKPDVLLIDVEMPTAVIATFRLGIPTLLPMLFFSIFRRPRLPPLHTALDPGTTRWQWFKIQLVWWNVRMGAIAQRVRRRLSRAGIGDYFRPVTCNTVQIAHLKALARHHGFSLRAETDRTQWLSPYTYRHLHVICYHPWELELPHDPSPLVHYVGPMINAERTEPPLSLKAARRWEALKAARARSSPRPLIYCSLSTIWAADAGFLRRVLEVFAKRSDWDLVLGLGGKLTAADLAPVPDNALLLDWAPQLEILAHADSFVTHGGTTSISESVWFGVPMVVYSTKIKQSDHDGNSMRVKYHGLGVVADKDTDGEEQIERNIKLTLSDPDIRRNVAAMRDRFHEYDQPDRAVELVESYIGRGC